MVQETIATLDAFCVTCPSAHEVKDWLQHQGFRLVFDMAAITTYTSTQMPPLPAQYHFRDQYNTEVIFLAGRDSNMDGQRYPSHSSRWWISRGADLEVYQRIAHALAVRWALSWRSTTPMRQDVA